MNIGARIKELRTINNLKSGEFANLLDISPVFLSYLENGSKNPSINTIEKICSVLGITLQDFFKTDSSDIIPEHFKEFINQNKNLTPEQLQKLNEFIKALK